MLPLISSLLAAVAAYLLVNAVKRRSRLNHIPAIGGAGIGSCINALQYFYNPMAILKEGYDKYPIFRILELGRWTVVVRAPEYIEELRNAPNSVISLGMAVHEILQVDFTLGHSITFNPYHIPLCSRLTRQLPYLFEHINDEISCAVTDLLPGSFKEEWYGIPALDSFMEILCRSANRAFVGLPLCRNKDFLELNKNYTIDVIKTSVILSIFPDVLKPLMTKLFSNVPNSIRRASLALAPLIEDRKNAEQGDYNDFLAWLIEKAPPGEETVYSLTRRILTLNFASIHTTAHSFTHALYHLAANPEYAAVLRQEVEPIIESVGWSLDAVNSMRKVDSFLKESQRYDGLGCMSMIRKTMQDFTFKDGTVVPEGTFLAIPSQTIHSDPVHYTEPEQFHPWRFAGDKVSSDLTAPSSAYFPFGYGRHACPGRFFASCEQKTLLAHIVLKYDLKCEQEGVRPQNKWFGDHCVPHTTAKVLLRRRS